MVTKHLDNEEGFGQREAVDGRYLEYRIHHDCQWPIPREL